MLARIIFHRVIKNDHFLYGILPKVPQFRIKLQENYESQKTKITTRDRAPLRLSKYAIKSKKAKKSSHNFFQIVNLVFFWQLLLQYCNCQKLPKSIKLRYVFDTPVLRKAQGFF